MVPGVAPAMRLGAAHDIEVKKVDAMVPGVAPAVLVPAVVATAHYQVAVFYFPFLPLTEVAAAIFYVLLALGLPNHETVIGVLLILVRVVNFLKVVLPHELPASMQLMLETPLLKNYFRFPC